MRYYTFLILCFFISTQLFGQESDSQLDKNSFNLTLLAVEDTLSDLGQVILEDPNLLNRQVANAKFQALFERAMKMDGAYDYTFDCLFNVPQLTAPDKSFRVFTWQFFEADDSYVYYGYIVHRDGRIIPLADKSSEYFTPQFEIGHKDHWYGALYYNMHSYTGSDGKMQYLLFGYDGYSLFEDRKIIDVLSWNEKNEPVFGADVFQASPESKGHPPVANRVLMEYFVGAKVSSNYEEIHEHILYDHLIFKKTPYGDFMVPDGSYEGYAFEEGKWRHVSKMFNHSYGNGNYPTPEPVLTKEKKKDLFGNTHKRASKNVNRNSKLYKEARANNKKLDKVKDKTESQNNP